MRLSAGTRWPPPRPRSECETAGFSRSESGTQLCCRRWRRGTYVAWFGAQWIAPELAPLLQLGGAGSGLNHASAFVVAFIGVLLACALLARLVRLLVQATPLSVADRALGAGFGLARGTLLLLAVAVVVALTPLASTAPAMVYEKLCPV